MKMLAHIWFQINYLPLEGRSMAVSPPYFNVVFFHNSELASIGDLFANVTLAHGETRYATASIDFPNWRRA